jgi:hypothetical protein
VHATGSPVPRLAARAARRGQLVSVAEPDTAPLRVPSTTPPGRRLTEAETFLLGIIGVILEADIVSEAEVIAVTGVDSFLLDRARAFEAKRRAPAAYAG